MILSEDQNKDLIQVVLTIQNKHIDELKKVMADAEKEGKGDMLRAV